MRTGPEHIPSDDEDQVVADAGGGAQGGQEHADLDGAGGRIPAGDLEAGGCIPASRPRRDLRLEARSATHLRLHKPFNHYCKSCVAGKMRKKKS